MLVQFTEAFTGNAVSVNPQFVIAVFTAVDGDQKGKTVIGVSNGSVVVNEDYLTVIGTVNGALN